MNKLLLLLVGLVLAMPVLAQDKEAEMADVMRSEGKIYTVVAVLGIILVGLIVYLIATERKLARIEDKLNK